MLMAEEINTTLRKLKCHDQFSAGQFYCLSPNSPNSHCSSHLRRPQAIDRYHPQVRQNQRTMHKRRCSIEKY
jgi:hypothetical protein